jgi:hypothetical protein
MSGIGEFHALSEYASLSMLKMSCSAALSSLNQPGFYGQSGMMQAKGVRGLA